MDYERDAEVLQPLANRYAISLAETEVNHGGREFSLLSRIQRRVNVAGRDDRGTSPSQGLLSVERNEEFVFDDENQPTSKRLSLHDDP